MEWSINFCDYSMLKLVLQSVHKPDLLPQRTQVLRMNYAWQAVLPPFRLSYAQGHMHRIIFPDDEDLPTQAHRAEPDVRMLINLMRFFKAQSKKQHLGR